MPIHFSISQPRTAPPYDPMTETVLINGTYSGAKPSKMWCVTGTGACPTATHNPFEAGAIEFMPAAGGNWSAPSPASAGSGLRHVRIWSIQPGSHEIAFADREYTLQNVMPPPPPPPPLPPLPATATTVSAKAAGKTSTSRASSKNSSKTTQNKTVQLKTTQSRTSQNGSPPKPATKPVKRQSRNTPKPKAAKSQDQGRRGSTIKSKPKAGKGKRAR